MSHLESSAPKKGTIRHLLAQRAGTGMIQQKKHLGPKMYEMVVYAPLVVHHAQPGQFVNVLVHENGKSVPLTIANTDPENGTITLVFQVVGKSTMLLASKNTGDSLFSILGPLGHPTEIANFSGTIICVAGGVGVAPMHPIIRAYHKAGNKIVLMMGARAENLLFWEDRMKQYADCTTICTDRGTSRDYQGSVIEPLRRYLDANRYEQISHVMAAGPLPLLKAIAETVTKPRGIRYVASAVSLMIDGTGMCFGCQARDDKGNVFLLCRDGPDVDGNTINWDLLNKRTNQYKAEEQISMNLFQTNPAFVTYLIQEQGDYHA